jgi:hypothetical protein
MARLREPRTGIEKQKALLATKKGLLNGAVWTGLLGVL